MKKSILTVFILAFAFQIQAQDLISGGSNSWIFHTPDGGTAPYRLHIAPKVNDLWDWSKEFEITSLGTVKISNKLAIGKGDAEPEGTFEAKSSNNMRVIINKNNNSGISIIPNNSDSWFHVTHGLSNNLHFSHGVQPGDYKIMTIKSEPNGGKIGIGTVSPDEKLTVNGKIHAKEVRVDLNIAPDYVFQKYYTGKSTLKEDYTMPTLEQVASFTKVNHHLPNVPSAKQIQKEGLHLKEMTTILLQKVEELTLYTIEQEKRIKALEAQLSKK